jgi:hypothetical protein
MIADSSGVAGGPLASTPEQKAPPQSPPLDARATEDLENVASQSDTDAATMSTDEEQPKA